MSTEIERWVVDLFEGDVAAVVADDGAKAEVDRALLPEAVKPGDVLRVTRDARGEIRWAGAVVDEAATAERMREAKRLLDDLRERDPGGDVVL